MTKQDFGIIIGCAENDLYLLKGCIESVKHSMGNHAIGILYDGYHLNKLKKITNHYNVVEIIDRNAVDRIILKKMSFGYGLTKMLSFWYSPFNHFLYLDADIIIYGNVMMNVMTTDYDIVISRIEDYHDEEWVSNFFYDKALLKKHFPEYRQDTYDNNLFCTGVFWSKKNIIDVTWYEEMLMFINEHPDVFKCGDQGLLNYMIFTLHANNKIRIGRVFEQILCNEHNTRQLINKYPLIRYKAEPNKAYLLHYAGKKPMVYNLDMAPYMRYFRMLYLINNHGYNALLAHLILFFEDLPLFIHKVKEKLAFLVK